MSNHLLLHRCCYNHRHPVSCHHHIELGHLQWCVLRANNPHRLRTLHSHNIGHIAQPEDHSCGKNSPHRSRYHWLSWPGIGPPCPSAARWHCCNHLGRTDSPDSRAHIHRDLLLQGPQHWCQHCCRCHIETDLWTDSGWDRRGPNISATCLSPSSCCQGLDSCIAPDIPRSEQGRRSSKRPAWVPHGVCRCMCWLQPVEARRGIGGIFAWLV